MLDSLKSVVDAFDFSDILKMPSGTKLVAKPVKKTVAKAGKIVPVTKAVKKRVAKKKLKVPAKVRKVKGINRLASPKKAIHSTLKGPKGRKGRAVPARVRTKAGNISGSYYQR